MLNEEQVWILIVNLLGFSFAITVFVINLKARYKDFSNYAIMTLISYDMLMASAGVVAVFGKKSLYCPVVIFFLSYGRICHTFLVLFIGFSLYSIIVKEKEISFAAFMVYLAASNILTLAINTLIVAFSPIGFRYGYCVIEKFIRFHELVIFGIGVFLPSVLTQGFIIYFYCTIRAKLKAEADIYDLKCIRKRIFAKRLIGFSVLFTFYFVPFLIAMIGESQTKNNDYERQYFTQTIALGLYPILNSLMYGFTKSSTRNLFSICIKNDHFEDQQSVINEMRKEGILQPRFYLDLIDESESNIFHRLNS